VILTDPQYRRLTKLAKSTGLTTSELLRRAVDMFILNQDKKA
jgi:predicted DNA-binding protein